MYFFFKIILVTLIPALSHINILVLLKFPKVIDEWGNVDVFQILSSPLYQQGLSPRYLKSSLVSFSVVLLISYQHCS